jgi:hypothetical protein
MGAFHYTQSENSVNINLKRPTVSSVRIAIAHFEAQEGKSLGHSGSALLLPYVLAYCEARGWSYEMKCVFYQDRRIGYDLRRLNGPRDGIILSPQGGN